MANQSRLYMPTQLLILFSIGVMVQAQTLFGSRMVEAADAKVHFRWVEQFAQSLAEGVLYPRWAALSYEGLGDPSFLYIHPLFYYASAALRILTGDTVTAMLWACTLANIFGTLFTLFMLRAQFRQQDWLPTLICALLLLSPYGFHLASYQQFLPMQFAMAFMTIYLTALMLPPGRPRRLTLILAVGLATASHILIAFMMLLCSLPALLRNAYREPTGQRLRQLLTDGLCIGVGLGLAGIYLIPALSLQSLITPTGWYFEKYLDWHNSFLFQTSLTMPAYGFRWFHLQWTVPILTFLLLCFLACGLLFLHRSGNNNRRTILAMDLLLVAVLALLLGTEPSYPLWNNSTILQRLQFPLRFLSVASVATTLGFGILIAEIHVCGHRRLAMSAIVLSLTGSLAMLLALEGQFYREARPAIEFMRPATHYPGQPEMRPAGVSQNWYEWIRNGGFQAECGRHGATCTTVINRTHERQWNITLPEPANLRLPLFAFPGWKFNAGLPQAINMDKDSGLAMVTLPAGNHVIQAHWQTMTAEWRGLGVSLVFLLATAVLVFPVRRRQSITAQQTGA